MPPSDDIQPGPAWGPLDARQRRVLGVLIEKAKTTPAAYPMTVNAIVTGCNQKNNRDPLTAYDDIDVEKALDELRTRKVVSEMDWLGRVPKYKHHAYEWLGVNRSEAAVMTELLLRGAQALGELRGRAARMEPIADLAELRPIVDALLGRHLMIELTPPGRGQIVSHNLYTVAELAELRARCAGDPGQTDVPERGEARPPHAGAMVTRPSAEPAPVPPGATEPRARGTAAEEITGLLTEIVELRAEVAVLRRRVDALEAKLGDLGG
jgi:hypothetical protein